MSKRLLDTDVRFFDQDSFNIPKLTNTWGCMVDFLDHTLVNNEASIQISSIETTEDLDYWVSSITTIVPHTLKSNLSVIEIEGSSELSYNGIFRVQEIGTNFFKIAFSKEKVPFKPPSSFVEQNTFFKICSLGYEKVFEGFQKAVYKTTTKKDLNCYLRVDNSCPLGHDPSWVKLSKVSMFSNIDEIDDYEFRLDRSKAPTFSFNYNNTEESVSEVWLNSRQGLSESYVDMDTSSNYGFSNFFIIGTSTTFYIYLRSAIYTGKNSDIVYTFGEYTKLIYKEDPLPFLLKTSEKFTLDRFKTYTEYDSLLRNRSTGKHTFTSDLSDNFTSTVSAKWAPFFNDTYLSGSGSYISFIPYKNEIVLNLFPAYLKVYRPGNAVMEGLLKGISIIMARLSDSLEHSLNHLQVLSYADKFYLTVEERDFYDSIKFLIHLDNWEI